MTAQLEKRQALVGKALGLLPGIHTLPPKLARPLYLLLDLSLGLPKQKMAKVEKLSVPLESESGTEIAITAYYPNANKALKAMVYFHGGGCVIGSPASHDRFCRYLAAKNQIAVFSVDYRLAPEFKFPQSIIDSIEAWNWINTHSEKLGIDKDSIGVGGDSAGAYLSALISLEKLHVNLPVHSQFKPAYQMLLYPMLDLHGQGDSYEANSKDRILTKALMHYFRDHYLNSTAEYSNPLASPLLADDLSYSPKTYLLTLEYDPLKDEGLKMAQSYQEQGVDLHHQHFEDCMHSFISVARVSKRALQATDEVAAAIKKIQP